MELTNLPKRKKLLELTNLPNMEKINGTGELTKEKRVKIEINLPATTKAD